MHFKEKNGNSIHVSGYRIDFYFHDYKLVIKLMNVDLVIEILTMKLKGKRLVMKTVLISLML